MSALDAIRHAEAAVWDSTVGLMRAYAVHSGDTEVPFSRWPNYAELTEAERVTFSDLEDAVDLFTGVLTDMILATLTMNGRQL